MSVLVGRTTAGTTADFTGSGNTAAWKFTAVASGDVATLWAQTKVTNTASASQLAIYADNGSGTAPAARLGTASVDNLASSNGTSAYSATLASPVTVASGTVYWLAWSSTGDNRNFQGTTGTGYLEATGTPPASWLGNGGSGTVDAILWAEDSGAAGGTPTRLFTLMGVGS